jgi:hypothetical protein
MHVGDLIERKYLLNLVGQTSSAQGSRWNTSMDVEFVGLVDRLGLQKAEHSGNLNLQLKDIMTWC